MKLSVLALASTMLFGSCASIVSKSNWPITIQSTPSDATITITDKNGIQVYTGNTPANLKLKSGSGFFGKASYQVKFEKEGYATKMIPVNFKVNGWYFGNILLGGIIGMLIVDPATGAMYKLEEKILNEHLSKLSTKGESAEQVLNVIDINDLPTSLASNLIKIN